MRTVQGADKARGVCLALADGGGIYDTILYGRELSAMDQIIGIMLVIEVIGLIANKSHAPRHSRNRSGLGGMPRAGRAAVGAMRR
jgi:hypothetical protein